jgi:hypothetical protein
MKLLKASKIQSSIEEGNEELESSEEFVEEIDYNQIFIDSLAETDKVIRFLKIYNQIDLVFIQSLLYSSTINSFAELTHLNNIIPTVPINGYNDMYLSIKESDYDIAKQIIEEYLSDENNNKQYNIGSKVINAVEILVGGTVIPDFKNRFKPNFIK